MAGDVAEGFACRLVGVVGLESLPDKVEASVLEGVALLVRPGSGEVGAGTVHGPGDLPEAFLRMEQVDDLDSVREELVGEAPDPAGAIAQDDAPPGVVEAAPARLARDPLREGGELGVAHGGTLDRRAGRGRAGSRMGRPVSGWRRSAEKSTASLISRVRAEPSGCFPARPSRSARRSGEAPSCMPGATATSTCAAATGGSS